MQCLDFSLCQEVVDLGERIGTKVKNFLLQVIVQRAINVHNLNINFCTIIKHCKIVMENNVMTPEFIFSVGKVLNI